MKSSFLDWHTSKTNGNLAKFRRYLGCYYVLQVVLHVNSNLVAVLFLEEISCRIVNLCVKDGKEALAFFYSFPFST